jgi:hypothetical protein
LGRDDGAGGGALPGPGRAPNVSGAGARIRHPFVRIANTFLSVPDVYALFGAGACAGR